MGWKGYVPMPGPRVEFQVINMQFAHGWPHGVGEPNADRWELEK